MRGRKDFVFGFMAGLILPLICVFVYIYFKYEGTLGTLDVLKQLHRVGMLYDLLPIGSIPNLLFLFVAVKKERWLMGRGVMSATLISAAVVIAI